MEQIDIRNASMGDVAALAELSAQLGYPVSYRQTEDSLVWILRSSKHHVFVAYTPDGAVVGWVHVFISLRVGAEPFAELGGFVVAEGYRGRGIGRALSEAAEDWARRHDAEKLRVRVRQTRSGAHKFYGQLGFSMTKEQHVFDKWDKKIPS